MFHQSQCRHPCKVPLIPFHLLRNLFCTSLSSCNQHHHFRLDGRAPMSSQTHSHVSLMITFLEPHLGQNSLRRNVSCQSFLILSWHTPLHLLLSAVSYFPWSNQMFKVHSNWHEFLCLFLAVLGLHCCGEQGLPSGCRAQPSPCGGFSFCSSWALEHRPSGCGSESWGI